MTHTLVPKLLMWSAEIFSVAQPCPSPEQVPLEKGPVPPGTESCSAWGTNPASPPAPRGPLATSPAPRQALLLSPAHVRAQGGLLDADCVPGTGTGLCRVWGQEGDVVFCSPKAVLKEMALCCPFGFVLSLWLLLPLLREPEHQSPPSILLCPQFTGFRLVNGSTACEGRVEVEVRGTWGSLCASRWDLLDAHVLCHHLGCGFAVSVPEGGPFGRGTGPVWNDWFHCEGTESSPAQCPVTALGASPCSHENDAAVICSGVCQDSAAGMAPRVPHGHLTVRGDPVASPGRTCPRRTPAACIAGISALPRPASQRVSQTGGWREPVRRARGDLPARDVGQSPG